ncbi:MAG: DUF2911 domain-containing protein [Cyclobacteriaceae bacterium]
MKIKLFFLLLLSTVTFTQAQFHTLTIPQASNAVTETQRLGVTDITITYGSPALNGRDVWNNPYVIPQNGFPIAWRAGANINTTLTFSTDVLIEGEQLAAGTYGFHVIPRGDTYTLLFAHNSQQWGSYYLDTVADITLRVDVMSKECPQTEKLDYRFINWTEYSVELGVEWADKRIPFTVSVDLNKTVVESFRKELRGINTYHWQAWNDAAQWCLYHNTNMEEALVWANRSINGGFNGFAANKNITNLSTKARILKSMDRANDVDGVIGEIRNLTLTADETSEFGHLMIQMEKYDVGIEGCTEGLKTYKDNLPIMIRRSVLFYYAGDAKKAVKDAKKALSLAPVQLQPRLKVVISEMERGTYVYPYL